MTDTGKETRAERQARRAADRDGFTAARSTLQVVTKYGQDTVYGPAQVTTNRGTSRADRRAAVKRAQVEARSKRGGTR